MLKKSYGLLCLFLSLLLCLTSIDLVFAKDSDKVPDDEDGKIVYIDEDSYVIVNKDYYSEEMRVDAIDTEAVQEAISPVAFHEGTGAYSARAFYVKTVRIPQPRDGHDTVIDYSKFEASIDYSEFNENKAQAMIGWYSGTLTLQSVNADYDQYELVYSGILNRDKDQ